MVMLEDIATHLQTQGVGTIGTNIFLSFMPDSPDVVVSLYEGPTAGEDDEGFGVGSTIVEKSVLHVRVRCSPNDYPSGRDKAQAVKNALNLLVDTTVSATLYHRVLKYSGPYLLDKDSQDRQILATNYDVLRAQ